MMMRRFDDQDAYPILQEDQMPWHSEILVVFVEQTECRHLRWLKQGFKHCFVALRSGGSWVICDSLKNRMECSLIDLPASFDLPEFYQRRGHTVVVGESSQRKGTGSIIPEPFTCVTVAKRIIGIRSFWTFTPWQLFCLLTSMNDRWRLIE